MAAIVSGFLAGHSSATVFTLTSPTSGGLLTPGFTSAGGIIFDAIGLNGNRVTSQTAASSLHVGYANADPQIIGTQTGVGPSAALLGGGISQLAIRITLFDGDTAAGNFDFNDNNFFVNGISLGNWSSIQAQTTSPDGATGGATHAGFLNQELDTGWFFTSDPGTLASIFTSLTTGSVVYSLNDVDPFDNFYDFTAGVDSSLINVNIPPVVVPNSGTVPDGGSTVSLLALGLLAMGGGSRLKMLLSRSAR